jgi:hypothetical protein
MRWSRFAVPLLTAVLAFAFSADKASASLLISVDKNAQRMSVKVDGVERHNWPVSTGRAGHETPAGNFTPFRLEEDHYSREWDDAPMPHSVFFTKQGHAIHGSLQTKQLGSPASAGCVRLAPANAATLFAMVKEAGLNNTKVSISGSEPAPLVAGRSPGNEARIIPPNPGGARVRGGEVDSYTARMRQRYYEERAAAESYAQGYYYDRYAQPRYHAPRVYSAQPYYAPQPYYGREYPYVRRYGY